MTPCRAYDSRTVGSPLAAGTPRNLTLAGLCGVPPDAAAVSANLTVTQPAAAGSLSALPAGVVSPATAAVNFRAGQTRANNAVLSLLGAPSGAVTFTPAIPSGTLHLVIDVTGFFQ